MVGSREKVNQNSHKFFFKIIFCSHSEIPNISFQTLEYACPFTGQILKDFPKVEFLHIISF